MDFAMQIDLLQATEYFKEQMETVYVRHNYNIHSFKDYSRNSKTGNCYYLSTWALMGLTPNDKLVRGQIELPENSRWKAHKNYKHGWVLFNHGGELYVYDPLGNSVWPQECWNNTFTPHKETFCMSQQEILDLIFRDDAENVYQIGDYVYQLKDAHNMKLAYDAERNGFLKDTLSSAQIRYGYGKVSYFLAVDHSK